MSQYQSIWWHYLARYRVLKRIKLITIWSRPILCFACNFSVAVLQKQFFREAPPSYNNAKDVSSLPVKYCRTLTLPTHRYLPINSQSPQWVGSCIITSWLILVPASYECLYHQRIASSSPQPMISGRGRFELCNLFNFLSPVCATVLRGQCLNFPKINYTWG